MLEKHFNVVWQTLRDHSPGKKKARPGWGLIKLLISVCTLIWKILRFFFSEGGSS